MEEPLKIVVVGEIDSGKSTLIGRFLYDTGSVYQKFESDFEFAHLLDSFEEERRNQLTIDTTQVFCKTKRGKEFVFIDVPGHRELLKNMFCGSSYADIAILVVDVQKSIEQQTKRHAFILKFLGIEQVIIVLNKMDLVGYSNIIFKKVKNEIMDFLNRIQIQPKYFIPTSAKQGDNLCRKSKKMDWYKGFSLINILNTCFKKKGDGALRFPIQDIYNLDGKKVAVGAVVSGKLRVGEKIRVMPSDKDCKVKAIKLFKRNMHFAKAPESIGLILDDMGDLKRGQVICKLRLTNINREILTKIFCVHSFNIKENLKFKCATQETSAQIKQIIGVWDIASLESKSKEYILQEADFAEAIVITENPVIVEKYSGTNSLGRFVLQNNKEIYAVGIIS